MPTDQTKTSPAAEGTAEIPVPPVTAAPKFASRDDFLAAAGKLAEEEFDLPGVGLMLLSEISGDARADILGNMASSLQADPVTGEKGKLDTKGYQRALLLNGAVDPTSPAGDRKPLFRAGDLDRAMKVGGAKIQSLCQTVERLSSMGQWQASVEGNSEATPSVVSTS